MNLDNLNNKKTYTVAEVLDVLTILEENFGARVCDVVTKNNLQRMREFVESTKNPVVISHITTANFS